MEGAIFGLLFSFFVTGIAYGAYLIGKAVGAMEAVREMDSKLEANIGSETVVVFNKFAVRGKPERV